MGCWRCVLLTPNRTWCEQAQCHTSAKACSTTVLWALPEGHSMVCTYECDRHMPVRDINLGLPPARRCAS